MKTLRAAISPARTLLANVRAWAPSLFVAALCSCSLTLDASRPQCSTTADCTHRGAAFAETVCSDSYCVDKKWGCFGTSGSPTPTSGQASVTLQVVDGVQRTPLVGVAVLVCRKIDTDCASPVVRSLVSDDSGMLTFDVDGGFDGYVSLSGAGLATTLYFFNPPVSGPTGTIVISMLTPATRDELATQIGSPLSPDRGVVNLTAVDCQGNLAAGVIFSTTSADADTSAFYSINQLPTTRAAHTDTSGFGGLTNVMPGVATVTGALEDGRTLETLSVLVRKGTITYSQMVPLGD